jgi:hypothetical protein
MISEIRIQESLSILIAANPAPEKQLRQLKIRVLTAQAHGRVVTSTSHHYVRRETS